MHDQLIAKSQFRFDGPQFYRALDGVRARRRLSWREVAAQSGVCASTLCRMGRGTRPDLDGFAALCLWAALDANDYLLAAACG